MDGELQPSCDSIIKACYNSPCRITPRVTKMTFSFPLFHFSGPINTTLSPSTFTASAIHPTTTLPSRHAPMNRFTMAWMGAIVALIILSQLSMIVDISKYKHLNPSDIKSSAPRTRPRATTLNQIQYLQEQLAAFGEVKEGQDMLRKQQDTLRKQKDELLEKEERLHARKEEYETQLGRMGDIEKDLIAKEVELKEKGELLEKEKGRVARETEWLKNSQLTLTRVVDRGEGPQPAAPPLRSEADKRLAQRCVRSGHKGGVFLFHNRKAGGSTLFDILRENLCDK